MPHDARAVANALIAHARSMGRKLDALQLIKLVYYAHAWMLAIHDRPLIGQPVEAWEYGPVIRDVYTSVKWYGRLPVVFPIHGVEDLPFDKDELDIIEQVSELYGELNGRRLSSMTHVPGTPWHTTIRKSGRNATIPNELIQDFYRQKHEEYHREQERGRTAN